MDGVCDKLPLDVGISTPLGGIMGRPRTLDYDKIRELYEQDCTLREIAKAIGGADHKSIGDAVKRMGLPKRPGHPQGKLDIKKDEVIADYLSGLSLERVAEKHACAKASVKEFLDRNGVELRHGAKREDLINKLGFTPTAEWFQEQLAKHQTAAAIARAYDVPYGTLMDRADKLGVKVPTWHGGPGPAGSPIRQDIDIEKAINLSNQGMPYWKVGEIFGVSKGVVMRRMKEANHKAPRDKRRQIPADASYVNAPFYHRKVLAGIGVKVCQICESEPRITCAHIVPQRDDGPTIVDNCLALCRNCHDRFDLHLKYPDEGHLTIEQFKKVRRKVKAAIKLYGKPTIQETAN